MQLAPSQLVIIDPAERALPAAMPRKAPAHARSVLEAAQCLTQIKVHAMNAPRASLSPWLFVLRDLQFPVPSRQQSVHMVAPAHNPCLPLDWSARWPHAGGLRRKEEARPTETA